MIIRSEPSEVYHASPAIGSTTAKLFLTSPQLFDDKMTGQYEVEDKPCFQVGRLAHMMVLEPERFSKQVTSTGPINEKTRKPYGRETETFAKWQRDNPDVVMVEPWINTALMRMPDEVRSIFRRGEAEVSAYTTINGLAVKCRPDYLAGTVITDLKTIGDVDQWGREITRRAYWFSHAWYRRVMLEETGTPHSFRLVFMEKRWPFRWRIVDLMADYVMYADKKVSDVLEGIGQCQAFNDWADHGDVVNLAELPDFMDESDDDGED